MKAVALNFQGGQYKQMFEKELGKACEWVYGSPFEQLFVDAHNCGDVKVPWNTCPYPKGPNTVHNYAIDDSFTSYLPPYMPGGEKWKVQILFLHDDVLLGGFSIYSTLRSEKSLLEG